LATPLSTGFSLGTSSAAQEINNTSEPFVSWTFRKQPKFFDVVTFTQASGSTTTFNHNLGSAPGCMLIKTTGVNNFWLVYHRSLGDNQYLILNTTGATSSFSGGFSVGSTSVTINNALLAATGNAFVAYLFAHDAGGFGASGTDNVISCGSFTRSGAALINLNLGYEAQWVLIKSSSAADDWYIFDTMRGMPLSGTARSLNANLTNAETSFSAPAVYPTATGFVVDPASGIAGADGTTSIYIAIRRGPMRTPTTGTSVFSPIARTGDGSTNTVVNVGFPTDFFMFAWRSLAYGWKQQDRLRGFVQQLSSDQSGAESNSGTYTFGTVNNTGYTYGSNACLTNELNGSGVTTAVYAFGRAPGFFDVVCYTGTGANRTVSHNLTVAPELMIVKQRNTTGNWRTYVASLGASQQLVVNATDASDGAGVMWNSTAPTASVFSLGNDSEVNGSGGTYVAYLFATVAGVSKVGSYTGTGTTLQVNCGFTGGSRFVLIKRTDSTGDWYVWDSARGIVAGNDSYLVLNSTAAEVTTTDWVDTHSPGFELSNAAGNNVNINGATYIFLSVA
jgi:hypothetical protein